MVVTNKQTHAATNKKLQVCLNIVGVKNNVRVIKKKKKNSLLRFYDGLLLVCGVMCVLCHPSLVMFCVSFFIIM